MTRSTIAIAFTIGVFATTTMAQKQSPYSGYKLPPAKVSSDMKYKHKFIEVLGSKMAYIDEGKGDPILFLHGQPTSSYLWRNIMPHVEKQARIIAPDNIGFGKSDQPSLKYTFGDHYRYLEAFIKKLELKNITLVVHDWGSGLGLHYAQQNPKNIKGIVTMESIIAPKIPAKSYKAMRPDVAAFFRKVRNGAEGRKHLIEENAWLKDGGYLQGFIDRPLSKKALAVYQQPFQTLKSRIQVNQWPNEMPIGGFPAATHKIVSDYNAWLEKTDTPWLFFYSTPGVLNPPEAADYWTARAKNIETVYIGNGLHYVQESHPYLIGRAISDWYRRLEAKK